MLPCYCYTDKCNGFIGKQKKAKDAVSAKDTTAEKQQTYRQLDEIERDEANIERAITEGQQIDLAFEPNEDDQLGRSPTPVEPSNILPEQDVDHEQRRENESGNSVAVQRASKRGRPPKKNAHKRLNKDLKEMKGRRSKSSIKVLKLRLSRAAEQATTDEEDSTE